jgi:glycosyltransferase involved in cell wall biosynthesis
MPLVSVIIPAFNNASLLAETLDGVRHQTFKDFEVIVVDDGSTDDTGAVVKRYDRQIIYCYQSNRGPAAARNKGVSLAKGQYIAFCDHDDIWNDRHLEFLLDCFSSQPTTAIVFDNAEYFGQKVESGEPHVKLEISRSLIDKKVPPRILWQCWVASMSVVVVKKAIFEKLGGLNEAILALDDLHFYLRLAANHEVRYVDYVGCRKRIAQSNLLPQFGLRGLVQCLEDIWQNHPEVVRSIGWLKFRLRLARKYSKLGRYYLQNNELELAQGMFWKAYQTNFFNPRYSWHALDCHRSLRPDK